MTKTTQTAADIPLITSVSTVSGDTRAWLVDIWGVMHNGVAPFMPAAEACAAFRRSGGVVVLVSNAPRPAASVQAQIDRIGVPRDAYDAIVSSGDVCRAMLATRAHEPLFHLGPDRDKPIFEGMPLTFVGLDAAAAVVCTGLFEDNTETAETYRPMLTKILARSVPMICANPDLTVERGNVLVYCAGAIAALYQEMGGEVTYAGKPHPPIYDMAFGVVDRLAGKPVHRSAVMAIGDGLRTDIAGAAAVGIRSVFIASGVHVEGGQLDAAILASLFPNHSGRPVAAMSALRT